MDIRPIRSQRDHAQALREVKRLWGARSGTPEADKLEILVTLIDAYEAKHHPIDPPDPIDAIRFRMEQMGLTRNDLVEINRPVARGVRHLCRHSHRPTPPSRLSRSDSQRRSGAQPVGDSWWARAEECILPRRGAGVQGRRKSCQRSRARPQRQDLLTLRRWSCHPAVIRGGSGGTMMRGPCLAASRSKSPGFSVTRASDCDTSAATR